MIIFNEMSSTHMKDYHILRNFIFTQGMTLVKNFKHLS